MKTAQVHACITLTLILLLGLFATKPAAQAQTTLRLAYEAVDLVNGADLVIARASTIDLTAYPVIPNTTGRSAAIAAYGTILKRDPHAISKVGDCNSTEWLFLHPLGEGQYDLGMYTSLQPIIDHYTASFTYQTYAAHNGLNVNAVLDPLWSNPAVCEAGEDPLTCEYRVHNPSIAVIMFGTNDMFALTPDQFDHNLRRVVVETMQAGIVPLLSTFPRHLDFPDRSILFNQIVVRVALDYHIPLMNLWLALEPLPNHGVDADAFHLNGPLTRAADFSSADNLLTGYPLRNLVTLQALEVIWRDLYNTP